MKRILSVGLLAVTLFAVSQMQADAISLKITKNRSSYEKVIKLEEKNVREVINTQLKYVNKHDLAKTSSLYTKDFVNNDGFDKELYFKLVKDTWETYPDITYQTTIKDIDVNDKYASVEVLERSVAVAVDTIDDIEIAGELVTSAKCIYHLEKVGSKWFIASEDILEEVSTLKYGDARFVNIYLNVPKQVPNGKYYTSTLNIDAPKGTATIAAINREIITYPQKKAKESFRVMPDDNILERMFLANSDNVNEYNVASVAIAKTVGQGTNLKVVMSGAAFIITRINVVPKNNQIKLEEENAETK